MDDLERIYEDVSCWANFEGMDEEETIGVYMRCSCGRYIKRGKLLMNIDGEVKLVGWVCKVHGEIKPYWERY